MPQRGEVNSSGGGETPYVETEALLAVMNGDDDQLDLILAGMLPMELEQLEAQAMDLADRCSAAIYRRHHP